MIKGKFQLIYIDEKGNVFPAYSQNKEGREMVDLIVRTGMFGENILVDRNTKIGTLKNKSEECK